jgi:hypothetical protein
VTAVVKRPKFTPEFEWSILKEYEACDRGELGALVRREVPYASHFILRIATTRRRSPTRALTVDERGKSLNVLHDPRIVDMAPG